MIPLFKVFMSPDVVEPVGKVLMSGMITQAKQVEKFEKDLKDFFRNTKVLTLNSATSGLTLAVRLLGLAPDDVVLAPSLTCFASTAAIMAAHGNLRWIDADPLTANVCMRDLKSKLSSNTKAVVVVHWAGNPVDLDALRELQEYSMDRFGFKPVIIQDCAHAFGATYDGVPVGGESGLDTMCVFSTQAIKHLTTGDGGIITFSGKCQELHDRCKLLRWYGIDRDKRSGGDFRLEPDIEEWGYKFHMNDISATIGIHNLPHISELLKKNKKNFLKFFESFKDLKNIFCVCENPKSESSHWLMTLRILGGKKEQFMKDAKEAGITVSQVHNRNDIHSCVEKFKEPLPQLDKLETELVCIPVGWWLEEADRETIIDFCTTWDQTA